MAVILVHDIKKAFYKKFLYEPFPVESHLLGVLSDHLNAEVWIVINGQWRRRWQLQWHGHHCIINCASSSHFAPLFFPFSRWLPPQWPPSKMLWTISPGPTSSVAWYLIPRFTGKGFVTSSNLGSATIMYDCTMGRMTMKSTRRALGYSVLRSLVRSHHSLIRSLRTACFARALRCADSFARSLTRSGAHGKEVFVYEMSASIS